MSLDEIIKVLEQAIESLAEFKQHINDLVKLFETLGVNVEVSHPITLTSFLHVLCIIPWITLFLLFSRLLLGNLPCSDL